MRRIVITGCLLTCVAICYMWWESCEGADTYSFHFGEIQCGVLVYKAQVWVFLANQPMFEAFDAIWAGRIFFSSPEPFTFRTFNYPPDPKAAGAYGFFPCSAALGLFAAYPLWATLRLTARRVFRSCKGRCLACGYDLTGNTSGACPECGGTIAIHETRT